MENNSTDSKSLSYAIKDGVYFATMVGIGESYISPFAIFLQATNSQIGFLASIPPLLGALVQLISINILNRIRNRLTIMLIGVISQALTWIPILLLPFLFRPYAAYLLILCVTIYFAGGNLGTPPWNSLMGDIVPERTRSTYFGYRNKIMSIFTLGSLVIGGGILHITEKSGASWVWIGFSILFFIALIARLMSAYSLSKIINPPYDVDGKDDFGVVEFLAGFRHSSFVRFVVYVGLMHFSVMMAGPFFSVFMLRDLHFSYLQFMTVSATAVLIQFLTLHNWGKFGDKFGNRKILEITGFTLPVVPVLWLFSSHFYYILMVQMLAGLSWAGFSLSMGNFIYDSIPSPKLAKSFAIFNVLIAVGTFAGAISGGWLSSYLPVSISISNIRISMTSNLQWLFLSSGVLRLCMALIFLPTIKEIKKVEPITIKQLVFRVTSLRPISGLRFDVFTGNPKGKNKTDKE
ncbi:MAG: MFS transporter [Nitrospirae bacterium]|nr:MFS transporter [Nitrospirota bacterium]